jgi:hypothetical protein
MLSLARSSAAASAPFSFFSRLASAMIVLPSTATSRPATSPAGAPRDHLLEQQTMQVAGAKAPVPVLEKVERSGTQSARSSRQNQP